LYSDGLISLRAIVFSSFTRWSFSNTYFLILSILIVGCGQDRLETKVHNQDIIAGKNNIRLYYGTNRVFDSSAFRAHNENPAEMYTANRDRETHYGMATVNFPKTRVKGSLNGLKVTHLKPSSLDGLEPFVKEHIRMTKSKDALVFIHGFNVDFNEALVSAAQLAKDIKYSGVRYFCRSSENGSNIG
jgi:esterase/lipase superfamily enzyme